MENKKKWGQTPFHRAQAEPLRVGKPPLSNWRSGYLLLHRIYPRRTHHAVEHLARRGGSNRHPRRTMALVEPWLHQRGSAPVTDVVHGLPRALQDRHVTPRYGTQRNDRELSS